MSVARQLKNYLVTRGQLPRNYTRIFDKLISSSIVCCSIASGDTAFIMRIMFEKSSMCTVVSCGLLSRTS